MIRETITSINNASASAESEQKLPGFMEPLQRAVSVYNAAKLFLLSTIFKPIPCVPNLIETDPYAIPYNLQMLTINFQRLSL